jgi:hypothetical protein
MPLDNTTKTKRITIAPLTEEELAAAREARSGGKKPQVVRVTRPRMTTAAIKIVGTSAYVQHSFSEKQRKQMEATQQAGQQARGRKVREPKDFNAVYEAAKHVSTEGWIGIPAPAFRNACISACKLVGIVMTRAKLSVFIVADGVDREDGTPLVRILGDKDQPHIHRASVRNESGVADVRWRPMWDSGKWRATVRVRWDEDQFSAEDIMNLMWRAGEQVGIGEGRADSPNSNGLGWGHFAVAE